MCLRPAGHDWTEHVPVSLDEREAVHPTYSTHPNGDGHSGVDHAAIDHNGQPESVDATALFFDELAADPHDDAIAMPARRHASDADQPPAGMTKFPAGGSGRHARRPAGAPEPQETDVFAGAEPAVEAESPHLFDSEFALTDSGDWDGGLESGTTILQAPPRRSAERELRRKRRRRRMLLAIVVVIVLVLAAAGWVGYKSFSPKPVADWTGAGTGEVTIQVHQGDGAAAIGSTLLHADVVRSVEAYTRASAANSKSADIAPGVYQVRHHMSGTAAVDRLLDPAAHIVAKVTVPEGTIEKDIITRLATALKVPESTVAAAAANIPNLGLPDGYAPAAGSLTSAEGFLYPDTYALDPGSTPTAALQLMASEFTTEDRTIGFADGAKKINLTPYQALIIASIAQAEVKFDSDAAKVSRVILNRMAANMPLQIDATSVYGAKIQGLDPTKVDYATIASPYNTYTHSGLPPTPIGNPGENVLKAAITPDDGDWLYYVNADAAGHLFFTNDVNAFEAAVAQCRTQNWGCG
jgi:UPF0755 protein